MVIRIQVQLPEIPEVEWREQRMAALLDRALGQDGGPVDYSDDLNLCGVCLQPLGYAIAHADAIIREAFASLASCICESCWDEYDRRLTELLPSGQTD